MLKKIFFCLVPTLCIPLLQAEVFSLWPFHGGEGTDSARAGDVLSPELLWQETVVADGRKVRMDVSVVRLPMDTAWASLRKAYPDGTFAVNGQTVLMEHRKKDGSRKRVLLVKVPGTAPLIRFAMEIPPGARTEENWPSVFPLPPGARAVSVMNFPDRQAQYGAFTTADPPAQTLSYVTTQLKNAGWSAVTDEHLRAGSGSGEVLIREKTREMILIGLRRDEKNNRTFCSLYMRKNH